MNDKDLSISICCNCNPCHDWMAFASWYSIKKHLPDTKVFLELNLNQPIFRWANKLGVRISRKTESILKIQPTVMAVRDFDGNLNISSSKSNIQSTFIDYSEGCGNFVADKWIHTSKIPFFKAIKKFGNLNLTVNEVAVLTIWEKCHYLYLSAGGT